MSSVNDKDTVPKQNDTNEEVQNGGSSQNEQAHSKWLPPNIPAQPLLPHPKINKNVDFNVNPDTSLADIQGFILSLASMFGQNTSTTMPQHLAADKGPNMPSCSKQNGSCQ